MDSSRKQTILLLSQALSQYNWLLNSYNVDYFLKNHWANLPKSWRDCLGNLQTNDIPYLLCPSKTTKFVFPLSLLSLRALSFLIRLNRVMIQDQTFPFGSYSKESDLGLNFSFSNDFNLPVKPLKTSDHILSRGIKLKKRHEIERLCKIIPPLIQESNCNLDIIDCGSGQGHLSRVLTLCYGYRVYCIEANGDNINGASTHDTKVLSALRKYKFTDVSTHDMPTRVNCFLTKEHRIEKILSETSPVGKHLLLGLHACGPLSNLIMEEFVNNPNTVALVLACCCYMKADLSRFPMSKFLRDNIDFELSIEAKELACHAIEKFMDKFNNEDLDSLKVHCYRACLEMLIDQYCPSKRHSAMKSVRINPMMTFKEYSCKATRDLEVNIPETAFDSPLVNQCIEHVDQVVIFYSLRLLVAPIVENFILLDYQQYLSEHTQVKKTYLLPLFNPLVSPRNSVLIAHK